MVGDAGESGVTYTHRCVVVPFEESGLRLAAAWTAALIIDALLFLHVLFKAIAVGRSVRVMDIIVHDCILSFAVITLINLANVLVLRFGSPVLRTSLTTLTNAFIGVGLQEHAPSSLRASKAPADPSTHVVPNLARTGCLHAAGTNAVQQRTVWKNW
ncbi:hypothetical protein BC834DRAFT_882682 [Gloeopeniophorella convolvens]|nr:hypothetical protein BC834DRAFT_882682 [Gloeopeniophorella convolvens]